MKTLGTVNERIGEASETMLAFAYALPGMPLIYSGQEYGMDKRLKFFEKDSIPKTKGKVWKTLNKLGQLKNKNTALNGAKNAASYQRIKTDNDEDIIAFERTKEDEEIYYIANFSDEKMSFKLPINGKFKDFMKNTEIELKDETHEFQAWEYKILVKNE